MEENGLMNFADIFLGKVVTKYLIFFSPPALKSHSYKILETNFCLILVKKYIVTWKS